MMEGTPFAVVLEPEHPIVVERNREHTKSPVPLNPEAADCEAFMTSPVGHCSLVFSV